MAPVGSRERRGHVPLLGLDHTPRALDRQTAAEAIDALTHQLQLLFDISQKAAVFGDFGGEVFVLDAGHIKRVARLDSPFTSTPLGTPTFYTHAARRAHIARDRIG